ncbi:CDP-glycerol glycerophosphotransferase family protein [Luteimicrobium xylanilyticum]|uniref:CDP-glycerol glycerophosphotransferase n=1 Tax=Luteimicrobium xylanilyticum TaxID=1133546 RepID=A0A5P9QDC8_9MICO|nr:CDP-glycerol glycerophosphotransferase family protein [Luteimicrobium xylanilyticum]QFU99092.1 hypothetical protein KDY119_02618 [Luteimicrobium xylanilyticum]
MHKQLRSTVLTVLAVVALLLAAVGAPLWVAVALTLVALVGVGLAMRKPLLARGTSALGAYSPSRSIAAAAVVVCIGRTDLDLLSALTACAAVIALVGISFEAPAGRLWRAGTRTVANLPGADLSPRSTRPGGTVVGTSLTVLGLSAVGVYVPAAGVVALVLALALAAAAAVWTLDALRRRPLLRPAIAKALEDYAAPVMVYVTGPRGTEYQVGVWLDQLAELDEKAVLVVRETALANKIAAMTTIPVVAAPTLADLEAVQASSFRVALYVNNGAKNGHNVRYADLTHVQLLHGDSDKPSSYNPVTAMFDRVFVAGQAGVDRYASHGVSIAAEKFVIVGRPQVAGIEPAAALPEVRTVLYAPTWTGFNQDNNFGSLDPYGPEIVRALLGHSWNVVFRPHPYSLKDARSLAAIAEIHRLLAADSATSGRGHIYGDRASADMSIVECFNVSDALVSDVSSVPADYLYSAKPFVITQVDDGALESFAEEFPLVRAAYVARLREVGSLDRALDGLEHDVLREQRDLTRIYYLGDIPRETYAETFRTAVTDLVRATPASRSRHASGGPDTESPGEADIESDDE